MIKIIVDQDHCYDGEYDICCRDEASYVQTRLLLDEVKGGERGNLLVLVKPDMAKYFEDLRAIPAWSEWRDHSYSRLIREHAPGLEDDVEKLEKLQSILGGKTEVIRFLKARDKDEDIDDNIMKYIFYQGERLKDIKSETELWAWFETATMNERTDWTDRDVYDLFCQAVKGVSRSFWDLLLSIKNKGDLDYARENVIATYLFNEYPPSSKNVLHQRMEFRDSLFFDPVLAEGLLRQHPALTEKINHTLYSCRHSLSIFESNNPEVFLRRTKGYLDEEWGWVWNYLNQHLSEPGIEKAINRLLAWCRTERPELSLLQKSFDLISVIEQDYARDSWEEWADFYTEIYLHWFPSLEREKNIIERLKGLDSDNRFLSEMIERIRIFKETKEREYQEFLFQSFPALLQHQKANLKLLDELKLYMEQEKVFLLVIDGLRWEIWEVVRTILEDKGYFLENDNQYCVSMLPSITSVSRIALFSAKTYDILLQEKRAGLFNHGVFDEYRQLQRYFCIKQAAFKIGGLDDLNALLKREADLYAFVYSQADHILHGAGDINRKALEGMLEEFIRELLIKIESRPGMLLAIATDHGSIKVSGQKQITPPSGDNYLSEAHGNSVYLWQKSMENDLNENDLSFIDNDKWHILREDMIEKYGLPLTDKNERRSVAWLFPRSPYYVGRKSGNYTHGGLSMQETIIPYGFFRKQSLNYQQLCLEIGTHHMAVEENSFMEIFIFNPNSFGLKKIEMNLAAAGIKTIIQDLAPRTRKRLRFSLVAAGNCCESGSFRDRIEIRIDYLNTCARQFYALELPVIVPIVQKSIKDDVAGKRSLDF